MKLFGNSVASEKGMFCKKCLRTGSLIMCSRCARCYHLSCANTTISDLPGVSWFCNVCTLLTDNSLKEEEMKLYKRQRNSQDLIIKDAIARINYISSITALRKFEEEYPLHVKSGKIMYPIEDTLLPLNPELHKIGKYAPIYLPQELQIPGELAGELLVICDFVWTFKDLLKLTPFGVEALYYSLSTNGSNPFVKDVCVRLLTLILENIFRSENIEETLNGECKSLLLAVRCSDESYISEYLSYYWNLMLTEIMKSSVFKQYTDKSIIQSLIQKKLTCTANYLEFAHFEYDEKVSTMLFMINCIYDSHTLRDDLQTRLENEMNLIKEKRKLKSSLRDKNTTSEAATHILEIYGKLENANKKTPYIGMDREYNEYYSFPFDPAKLYVKKMNPVSGADSWYFYPADTLDLLQCSLCIKGVREQKLMHSLRIYKNQFISTGNVSSSIVYSSQSFVNKYQSSLESIKDLILDTESIFSQFLLEVNKVWVNPRKQSQ